MAIDILVYDNAVHRQQVTELLSTVFGYEAAHNSPDRVIDEKVRHNDGLFFVAGQGGKIIGTAMAGYDGHRGWIYSIAVHPDRRSMGIGSHLLNVAVDALKGMGCRKVNLQILAENEGVKQFYLANGFEVEPRVSMGKRLYQGG